MERDDAGERKTFRREFELSCVGNKMELVAFLCVCFKPELLSVWVGTTEGVVEKGLSRALLGRLSCDPTLPMTSSGGMSSPKVLVSFRNLLRLSSFSETLEQLGVTVNVEAWLILLVAELHTDNDDDGQYVNGWGWRVLWMEDVMASRLQSAAEDVIDDLVDRDW